jgi:Response regulator containing CheY-like receiver, AAA-type ATPase, and DNA-binding domains
MPKTLLVVDDDPQFLSALTPLLWEAGYTTITAKDGKEAEDKLEGGTLIDGAIVDLELPEVGGFQIIARICTAGGKSLPVVAITGAYSDLYLEVAEYLGAKISIRKPPPGRSLARLVEAIEIAMSGPKTATSV